MQVVEGYVASRTCRNEHLAQSDTFAPTCMIILDPAVRPLSALLLRRVNLGNPPGRLGEARSETREVGGWRLLERLYGVSIADTREWG